MELLGCQNPDYIGRAPPIPEVDLSVLKSGDMLAVNCQDSDKEPVIASCISVREDYIDVVWYDGNYSSS